MEVVESGELTRAMFEGYDDASKSRRIGWGAIAGGEVDARKKWLGARGQVERASELVLPSCGRAIPALRCGLGQSSEMFFQELGPAIDYGHAFEKMHPVAESSVGKGDAIGSLPLRVDVQEESTLRESIGCE